MRSILIRGESVEKWKYINGYGNKYIVSSEGKFINLTTGRTIDGHIQKNGYVYICLSDNGNEKNVRAHKIVATAFLAKENGKYAINHKNGIKHDNRACNLEWCTNSENQLHRYRVLNSRNGGRDSVPVRCIAPNIEAESISEMADILFQNHLIKSKSGCIEMLSRQIRNGKQNFQYKGLQFKAG